MILATIEFAPEEWPTRLLRGPPRSTDVLYLGATGFGLRLMVVGRRVALIAVDIRWRNFGRRPARFRCWIGPQSRRCPPPT